MESENDLELPEGGELEWRYTTTGSKRHLVNVFFRSASTVCGIQAWTFDYWLGAGSQEEYEKVASLPNCRSCVRQTKQPFHTKADFKAALKREMRDNEG